ncbi:uncharacterized protein Dwil_GK20003 [Drosophila willistoni]|uniref:Uncharacterized protein n=1 Tax=Drosophila willistoni TaxID=7260 RepID=B4MSN1_DROWI|nr:uncharacterized protein Dwil_GK20003 [Drosophila willistoni]
MKLLMVLLWLFVVRVRGGAGVGAGAGAMLLKLMQNHTRFVYHDLVDDDLRRNISNVSTDKANDDLKAFDYREMNSPAYDLFRSQYQNFLPNLRAKKDKKLQLRNIHRNLEFYVAAFSYLRHAQLLADMESSNYESVISSDLERLRSSARSMLCNVDTTIMEINRLAVQAKRQKNNIIQKIPLKTMPKLTMERRLGNFKTDIVELHKLAIDVAKHGASIPPQMLETTQLALDKYVISVLDYISLDSEQSICHRKRIVGASDNKQHQQQQQQKQPRHNHNVRVESESESESESLWESLGRERFLA